MPAFFVSKPVFIGIYTFLHCPIYVIPRKGDALTWESPGTIHRSAHKKQTSYREIATSLRSSQ